MDLLTIMGEEYLLDMTIPIVVSGANPTRSDLELSLINAGLTSIERDMIFTVRDIGSGKIWFVSYGKDLDLFATVKMKEAT